MANGNGITSVAITNNGTLYEAKPIVRIDKPTAATKPVALTATIDSAGTLNGITIDSEGTYYTGLANISFYAPDSGSSPTALTTLSNGRIVSVSITDSGGTYSSPPIITATGGQGGPGNFRASADVNYDSAQRNIASIYIVDSGDFYITSPNITIEPPLSLRRFSIGETVQLDTFSDGTIMKGEVSAYADSDNILSIIHLETDNGTFKEPSSGSYVTGLTSTARGKISKSAETSDTQTQNDTFSTEIEDFLDFSESNPFGEVSTSGSHSH